MLKCPLCFEDLTEIPQNNICPHCSHIFTQKPLNLSYPTVQRKKCYFCGKQIAKEATYCRYCHEWLDEVDDTIRLLEDLEDGKP